MTANNKDQKLKANLTIINPKFKDNCSKSSIKTNSILNIWLPIFQSQLEKDPKKLVTAIVVEVKAPEVAIRREGWEEVVW